MLSMPRLVRLAETDQYDRLLDEILRNGRPLPLAARLRFSAPDTIAVSALSLALSRMTELTHRPTAGAQLLADKLLAIQSPDGSFGPPAVTASAAESMLALLEQDQYVAAGLGPELRDHIEIARDRAMHALHAERSTASAQGSPGLLGDALETALTLWRLGGRAVFDGVIGVASLKRAIAESLAMSPSNEVAAVLDLCPINRRTSLAA